MLGTMGTKKLKIDTLWLGMCNSEGYTCSRLPLSLPLPYFPFFLAPCGAGHPSSPCPFTFSSFPFFYFSLSFIGFTYFLLLSIPSLSTRIDPLRFPAGGRRRLPNLGLVCVLLCNLCYLYCLVKMDCGVLFYLV